MFKKQNADFIVDEYELRTLARHYLTLYLEKSYAGFVSGQESGSSVSNCLRRFDEIRNHLADETTQEIIDDADQHYRNLNGDSWECFKLKFEPGFFSRPADKTAIMREVNRLPVLDIPVDEYWQKVEEVYSVEYARMLKSAFDNEQVSLTNRLQLED